jgi:hypothetical protein
MATSAEHADRILSELMLLDFANQDISILHPDRMGRRDFGYERCSKAPEGATIGASMGGALGSAIGLAVGMGAVLVPDLGAFASAGPVMSALSGAALGAAFGGLAGTLVGMGIPEYVARQYQGRLPNRKLVISVHVENELERERACWVFQKEGADAVATVSELPVPRS